MAGGGGLCVVGLRFGSCWSPRGGHGKGCLTPRKSANYGGCRVANNFKGTLVFVQGQPCPWVFGRRACRGKLFFWGVRSGVWKALEQRVNIPRGGNCLLVMEAGRLKAPCSALEVRPMVSRGVKLPVEHAVVDDLAVRSWLDVDVGRDCGCAACPVAFVALLRVLLYLPLLLWTTCSSPGCAAQSTGAARGGDRLRPHRDPEGQRPALGS